ncbi:putative arginase [Dioszegia hungarica]|uniref:Arginase n=1 Tax=Dioszegia hungarica TaxID=4972 RepID=A0AA38HC32_9TREE|nr:putative arginase [Dioszegia hungarica]KAI9637690.1 putative arginase [Dioszegia hungarica]
MASSARQTISQALRGSGSKLRQSSTSTLAVPETGVKRPSYRYKYLSEPHTAAIIPCPFNGGQGRKGVELGPNRLIQAGLPSQLTSLGWSVSYDPSEDPREAVAPPLPEGDAPIGRMKNPRLVSEVNRKLMGRVGDAVGKGWLPVTLGGDHSLGMGTVAGTKSVHPDAALIWVDAHADINTPETTPSGNLHGLPVSFLLGLSGTDVAPFNSWMKPCLRPTDIVYIGLRDVDEGEKRLLRENGIRCFTMHEVDKYGIGRVMEMALDHVMGGREMPLHLSFDVDALDPTVAPSTGTPVRGGLTFREGHYITEAVAETGCLVALDIMRQEVNPSLKDSMSADETVAVGCSLARAALGETLL